VSDGVRRRNIGKDIDSIERERERERERTRTSKRRRVDESSAYDLSSAMVTTYMSLPPHEVIGSSVRHRANVPTLNLELFAFAHRLTKSLKRTRPSYECAATRSIIAMCQFLARFSWLLPISYFSCLRQQCLLVISLL